MRLLGLPLGPPPGRFQGCFGVFYDRKVPLGGDAFTPPSDHFDPAALRSQIVAFALRCVVILGWCLRPQIVLLWSHPPELRTEVRAARTSPNQCKNRVKMNILWAQCGAALYTFLSKARQRNRVFAFLLEACSGPRFSLAEACYTCCRRTPVWSFMCLVR